MYARATVNEYNNGLKVAQNVLTFPTGAAGKRFGTLYNATLSNFTAFDEVYFQTFQYLSECVYQIVVTVGFVYIYLEGILVATVSNTFTQNQVFEMNTTVLGNAFRMAMPNKHPYDLTRSSNTSKTVTSVSGNNIFASSASFQLNSVFPFQFEVSGGSIIQTTPQISQDVTYFAAITSATSFVLFTTSYDAKQFLINSNYTNNLIKINSAGTGTTVLFNQNTWTLSKSFFRDVPIYDFNGPIVSYDNLVFTPTQVVGSNIDINISGSGYSLLDSSYVGGAFIGGGGTSRIVGVSSATKFTVSIQKPFDSTMGIQGSLAVLAEPAWSDSRGWPQVCSSYQNRALFANSTSLPNGFWASVINDYTDFGDLTNDDDDAISWYPTSNNMNFIRFIVPYRSITVHTNTGIYSSPLSDIAAITPSNFTLQLQDSTPADVLLPQAIDNQIVVLSGNDAHQMLWDGINNAYTSDVVSIINEQTIRSPIDEVAFSDLTRAGSRFVFIINQNGSLASFQTLISQNVSGITPQIMEQPYGTAQFIQAASSSDGRCWFVIQRDVTFSASPLPITGFTSTTLHAGTSNFSTTSPTAITFTTTGSLPASTPPLAVNTYYWAIGTDVDDFKVYASQADAMAGVNEFRFTSYGLSSNVVAWNLEKIFTLEELTFDTYLDCAVQFFNNAPTDTVSTGVLFNGQTVSMVGDGFGFTAVGEGDVVVFESHGQPVNVTEGYIGYPIRTIMEPMPLVIANGPSAKETTLTKPKHIRSVRFMFNNTIGGTINGVPIALAPFDMANIGEPPSPQMGIMELMVMSSWDDFNFPTYTIEHSDPFPIQLLGVFYSVEV
jgi:hypothetical protein